MAELTWKDFIKVQRSCLIPAPWFNNFTRRNARNSRKKLRLNVVSPPL